MTAWGKARVGAGFICLLSFIVCMVMTFITDTADKGAGFWLAGSMGSLVVGCLCLEN